MAKTTTTLASPVVRTFIADEFADEFNTKNLMPFLKHTGKMSIGKHAGKTVDIPSLIHNAGVLTVVNEGSNVGVETYKVSAVKAAFAKYGVSAQPTMESIVVTNAGLLREMIQAQMRQAHRGINLLIAQTVGYSGLLIRADRDTNYQAWVDSTAIGTTTNIIVSTNLVADDDRFNGGRGSPILGAGQGWTRCISDYTGSTGTVITGTIVGVANPFDVGIDDSALYTQVNAADKLSHSLVSAPNGLSSTDIINTSLISYGQFIHKKKLHTVQNKGGMPWRLYLDAEGVQDLMDSDSLFRAAVQNYRGEFFDEPSKALHHWWNTSIFESEEVFRCTNTGADTDAAYSSTGAVHLYPLVGNDAFRIPDVKLWGGSGPGGLEFFLVNTPDHANPDLAFITIGYKLYMTAMVPFNGRVVNLACGSAQAA